MSFDGTLKVAMCFSTELLIERVGGMHPTDKPKDEYDKLATELQASTKTMDYHLEAIKLANKKKSGHVS